MEALLIKELGSTSVTAFGHEAGGCISKGRGFMTDNFGRIFVKQNTQPGVDPMLINYSVLSMKGFSSIVITFAGKDDVHG
jgi:hypothetical protein